MGLGFGFPVSCAGWLAAVGVIGVIVVRAVHASLSRLSHLVKRLESWGFVRRQADPANGRFTNAILTEAGYAKLVASAPSHVACVRQLVIDEFSPAELARLRAAAERITARVGASAWRQELT
jgi:DNA-binding MarR family transcriptional regulator